MSIPTIVPTHASSSTARRRLAPGRGGASALCLAVVLAVIPVAAARPMAQATATPQAKESIPGTMNYTRGDATFACAGATGPEAMPKIKELGFASVISLRLSTENGANIDAESAAAAQAGLKFIHIPVSGSAPEVASIDRFLDAVKDTSNQPMFIHCASANRASALWSIKRVMLDGWTIDRAMTEAETLGLTSAGLKKFAVDYLKDKGKS